MKIPNGGCKQTNPDRLLRPRHIAYIGGSHVAGPLALSQRAGFSGDLWVVNPNRDEMGGLQTFARIEDLPRAPDAALIALSPHGSIKAIAALAAIGAGGLNSLIVGQSPDLGLELNLPR
jgi:acyl-CoA synthetase (NDP forming)